MSHFRLRPASGLLVPILFLALGGMVGAGCAPATAGDPGTGVPEAPLPEASPSPDEEPPPLPPAPELPGAPEGDPAPDRPSPPDHGPPADSEGFPWTEGVLSQLTLRQKVGQMVMPWIRGDFSPEGSEDHQRIVRMLEDDEVGGFIVSAGSPTEVAVKLNDLQVHSRLPLLMAADLETGAGFRFRGAVHLPGVVDLGGATAFPPAMALGAAGDRDLAYQKGRITAVEARAVGIHLPFAPVLDVNSNPENPIINVRSFGEDPREVARLGSAVVQGLEEHGAVATGKHFPGHGDTETDSHLALPIIRVDRERLESVELVPFREAIRAGMRGIMTAHISLPEVTGDLRPSTLSPAVLTGLLRGEMGFDGLIFTDALNMRAVDRAYGREEAAVLAVEAGADVLLMPPSPSAAIRGVVRAVESGRISERRIDASVRRLLRLKEEKGLDSQRTVDPARVPHSVGIPEHMEMARTAARESITVLRNEGDLLPLLGTRGASVLSVTYRRRSDLLAGRSFNARLRGTYPGLVTAEVDRDTPDAVYEGLIRQARRSQLVVVSLHVTAVSYAGSVAIPEETVDFIRELDRVGVPHVVISFGNPYLIRDFPDVRAYLLAWGSAQVSQEVAAEALFGEFEIRGRAPIRIPPRWEIGDGIRIPPR